MLYLIQCLIPGLVLVCMAEPVPSEGVVYTTSRGLPPSTWIREHSDMLIQVVGRDRFSILKTAAWSSEIAFALEKRPATD